MFNVRQYKNSDYQTVAFWWLDQTAEVLPGNCYGPKWTWMVEDNKGPIACVSLLLTNSPQFAYFNALIGNPDSSNRREAVSVLFSFLENHAKELGYKNLFILAENDNLVKYYQNKHFNLIKNNLTILSKEI